MDLMRNTKPWKLPASLDKYKTVYQKDYCWHNTYQPPSQEDIQKTSFYPDADSYLPRCYLPKCQPPIEATPGRSGKLEILAEPQEGLFCCRDPPALPQRAETEETLLPKANPDLVSYVEFTQGLYRERLDNAEQNKNKVQRSSVLMKDCSELDWRSTYQVDFQHQAGVHGGLYTEEPRPSPIFPAENHLNRNTWMSEYADSYSVFLKKLDWSTPIPCPYLSSGKDLRWTPRWAPH